MSNTKKNIFIPVNEWVDIYELAEVQRGTPITVENIGVADIYLAIQLDRPEKDHSAYNILRRTDPRLTNNQGDSGAWAFCASEGSSINVSENNENGFLPVIKEIANKDLILINENIIDLIRIQLEANNNIICQLRLLNARIEEAFNTEIEEEDLC